MIEPVTLSKKPHAEIDEEIRIKGPFRRSEV